jgi:hypothetical protein
MPAAKILDEDLLRLIEEFGPEQAATRAGLNTRNVYRRRASIEAKLGRQITGPAHHAATRFSIKHDERAILEVRNGVVLVGSDAHYWPGPATTAHRAFVAFIKEFRPAVVVKNGDSLDAASISRHPPIGWENQPTLVEEIETTKERHHEIELATPRGSQRIWNLGNHDARFETRIATVTPQYAKLHGVHLKDHFPLWQPAWSTWINNDVVVKHRWKGGIHATHNNTVQSGKHIITGHLHSAKVTPYSDYNGTRYGVDTGCIADPNGPQFNYTEDNPKNWRSGFCLLTFKDGVLLLPELVLVWDADHVQFRGKLIAV